MKLRPPEISTILPVAGGGVLYVVATDFQHDEIRAKFFRTIEEADDFHHAVSLANLPEWHKVYCERCRKEEGA